MKFGGADGWYVSYFTPLDFLEDAVKGLQTGAYTSRLLQHKKRLALENKKKVQK